MYCKHCGKEISNDSKFCNYCGKEQDSIKITNKLISHISNLTPQQKNLSLIAIIYSLLITLFAIKRAGEDDELYLFFEITIGYILLLPSVILLLYKTRKFICNHWWKLYLPFVCIWSIVTMSLSYYYYCEVEYTRMNICFYGCFLPVLIITIILGIITIIRKFK